MMWKHLVKFLRLSNADRWLVIRAFLALAITRMALAIVRFAHKSNPLDAVRRMVALNERLLPVPKPHAPADHIAWAVKAVGESLPGFENCLVQAIALEALLKVAHQDCQLQIGVARTASGEFLAHAWIEKEGKVLVGEFKPGSFQPLGAPGRTL